MTANERPARPELTEKQKELREQLREWAHQDGVFYCVPSVGVKIEILDLRQTGTQCVQGRVKCKLSDLIALALAPAAPLSAEQEAFLKLGEGFHLAANEVGPEDAFVIAKELPLYQAAMKMNRQPAPAAPVETEQPDARLAVMQDIRAQLADWVIGFCPKSRLRQGPIQLKVSIRDRIGELLVEYEKLTAANVDEPAVVETAPEEEVKTDRKKLFLAQLKTGNPVRRAMLTNAIVFGSGEGGTLFTYSEIAAMLAETPAPVKETEIMKNTETEDRQQLFVDCIRNLNQRAKEYEGPDEIAFYAPGLRGTNKFTLTEIAKMIPAAAPQVSAEEAALREVEHELVVALDEYDAGTDSKLWHAVLEKLAAVRALRPKTEPTPAEIAKSELDIFDTTELFDDEIAKRMYELLANSDLVERDGRLVPANGQKGATS